MLLSGCNYTNFFAQALTAAAGCPSSSESLFRQNAALCGKTDFISDNTGTKTLASSASRSLRTIFGFMIFPDGQRLTTAATSSGLTCSRKLSITSESFPMRLKINPTGRFSAFLEQSAAKTLRVIASNGREAIISAHASSISGLFRTSQRALRNSVLFAK